MIVRCSYCNKEFVRNKSQVSKKQNSFCSKECFYQWLRNGSIVECSLCGKSFYKSKKQIRENNFCSNVCRRKWLGKRNVEVLNVKGHSKGHKAKHLSKLNAERNKFCKIAENDKSVHSSMYRKIVEENIGRKLKSGEVVHHVNGNREDNSIENLQVMSKSEHHKLHMDYAIKRFNESKGGGVYEIHRKI